MVRGIMDERLSKEECKRMHYVWVEPHMKGRTYVKGFCRSNPGRRKTPEEKRKIDRRDGSRTINGVRYDYGASHPLAFEDGVYAVGIHKSGTPHVDKNIYFTQVMARNNKEAVEKAFEEMQRKAKYMTR